MTISYLEQAKRCMVEAYGAAITKNPWESGFLLADGTWLKMGIDKRGEDHRFVAAFVRGKLGNADNRWDPMVKWQKVTGSIRWLPDNFMFDAYTRPTPEQILSIGSVIRRCPSIELHLHRGKQHCSTTFTSPMNHQSVAAWIHWLYPRRRQA